jgi:YfiR/HmsC-like
MLRYLLRNRAVHAAVICLVICVLGLAGQSQPSEYDVEATYLYHFSRFVEWPSVPSVNEAGAFSICVLGRNPFGHALANTVANETIDGKSVVAKQVVTPEDAAVCRVLFISSSEERRLKQIIAELGNMSVLTVSDLPWFTGRGGMIQFVLQDNRVRFQVNVATAKRAGLVMSSELLKLATEVRNNSAFGN